MIVATGEIYDFIVYKRKENSAYEWEEAPAVSFKGKPASQLEKRKYRVQKGVNSSTDSTFIMASNLPEIVGIGDKVIFLGKEWTVETTGYYFDASRLVNARIMNEEYIAKRCPKGLSIQ